MFHYRWCGLTLATDIEFPELNAAAGQAAREWRILGRAGRAPRRAGRRWFHRWRFPDGRRWVAFARDPAGYVLRFPGLVDFDVRPAERQIECYALPDTPANTLRHLALDQVLPLVVGTPDSIALHGSVIGTPQGAIAILGESGLGKSTLAAILGQRGYPVLSDDCCLLVRRSLGEGGLVRGERGFTVMPSYPGVRLNPDSMRRALGADGLGAHVSHYSQKRRVGDQAQLGFSEQPVPLSRVYVIAGRDELAAATAIAITDARKRDAMYALIDYTFHLDIGDTPRVRDTFELTGAIVDGYGVRRLLYPWDLSASDALADAILSDALSEPGLTQK